MTARKQLTTSEKRTRTRRRNAAKRRRNAARRLAEDRLDAWGRLVHDKAADPDTIRKRLLWLAQERGIPLEDVPPVRSHMTQGLLDFCQSHGISLKWVTLGRLKDLLEMLRQPQPEQPPSTEEFLRLLARCSTADRDQVVRKLRTMVDGG
jgi:hypothetical protein